MELEAETAMDRRRTDMRGLCHPARGRRTEGRAQGDGRRKSRRCA